MKRLFYPQNKPFVYKKESDLPTISTKNIIFIHIINK